IGVLMLAFGLTGGVLAWRKRLFVPGLYHRWALFMGPLGFVALLAGWWVTEVGRQPYVVYGLMRTSDAASPIGAPGVALSLLGFVIVYLTVFAAGITYMFRLMAKSPEAPLPGPPDAGPTRLAHTVSD